MLPTSATRYRFPRPSSISSNERMYSLSCMTFSTRPMSFDAGRIMHSAFPPASALRIVTMASLSASWSIASLSCISGSRARTRSPGSTGGTGGARTAARCPACDRIAGNPSSARSLSFASLDHLDLEVIRDELDALGPRHAVSPRNRTGMNRATGDAPPGSLEAHAHIHPEHADLRIVLHSLEVRVVLRSEEHTSELQSLTNLV